RRSYETSRHRSSGHHGCGLRHSISEVVEIFNVGVVQLAEVVPDRSFRRHDVRLISSVVDHVMRALLQTQMFTAKVPAGVHQLDSIERAAPIPWCAGGMGGTAVE